MSVFPLPAPDLDHVLDHTRHCWHEAKGASFFLTGGTGFFGMWLLESFCHINRRLDLRMSATVLTRNSLAFKAKAPHLTSQPFLHLLQGDVRHFAHPTGTFQYLVHAATAASAHLNETAPHEMLNVIVEGTQNMLHFAKQAGIKKLLFTSSGAVYGAQPAHLSHLSEDYLGAPDPLLPSAAYGEGKRVAEHLCCVHAHQNQYEAKIARCFAFVGPHLPLNTHFAIGNFIRDSLKGSSLLVQGDGSPLRSYLYASDLAIWLWTILFKGRHGRAYNVGSSEPISIESLASLIAHTQNPPLPVSLARPKVDGHPPLQYVPCTQRAASELGLMNRVSLAESVARTQYYNKQ